MDTISTAISAHQQTVRLAVEWQQADTAAAGRAYCTSTATLFCPRTLVSGQTVCQLVHLHARITAATAAG